MKKIFRPEIESVFLPKGDPNATYEISYIALSKIKPGRSQPRKNFDEVKIKELADSIKNHGILQPIVVRKILDGNDIEKEFEIIAGERRFRAANLIKLSEIPVIIRDFSDDKATAVALIENIQRENLNPIEEARAYYRLLKEFDFTHEELANKVGKSRSTITNFLRLLDLQEDVINFIDTGKLSMGHARALLSLPSNEQAEVALKAVTKKLSVRDVERICKRKSAKEEILSPEDKKSKFTDINFLDYIKEFFYPLEVNLKMKNEFEGKIELSFSHKQQIEGFIKNIQNK